MSTKTANIGNVYNIPNVVISPIMDDQSGVLDNNLEPSYVRIRSRNASFTWVDTFDSNSKLSENQFLISSPGTLMSKRTKRFALSYYASQLSIPNINPRNNTIVFQVNNLPTVYTAVIPEGFYTRTQAIAALLTAMNGVGSGTVFTAPSQFPGSDIYIILSGTTNYRILNTSICTFVNTGYAFWGFLKADPRFTTLAPYANNLPIGPISTFYTRYYDVTSQYLLQHTKAANTGNRVLGNTLFRIYSIQQQNMPADSTYTFQFPSTLENSSWNFDAMHSISNIDINLFDEFGQPLYLPNGITNGSFIQFSLTNEI